MTRSAWNQNDLSLLKDEGEPTVEQVRDSCLALLCANSWHRLSRCTPPDSAHCSPVLVSSSHFLSHPTSLSVYLFLVFLLMSPCLSRPLYFPVSSCFLIPGWFRPPLPPAWFNSPGTSWPCPYQSVVSPHGSWDARNALCTQEHPLWHY